MAEIENKEKGTKTLSDNDIATHVAQVVHHGAQITLPVGMDIPNAIKVLQRRQEYMDQKVNINEEFDVFPYDGAMALDYVLEKTFGWSPATSTPGFFGPTPPALVNVRTGCGVKDVKRVTWGRFIPPGVEGFMETAVTMKKGRYLFKLTATIKRKDEGTVKNIFDAVRERVRTHSIYRGKAIKIRFKDENNQPIPMPEPEFIDVDQIDESQLIYSRDVHESVETNLFTPILRVHDALANGMRVKRGVLLGGTYGTGKTLAATVASKYAVQTGLTYLYIPRAAELAEAIEFAKQYQSPACVVFCEDIDREMSGERNEDTDEILNIIDGIDTKAANIIVVLTTNALNQVEPAMLRPGRLDAVINVTEPDADAVERLLRWYGGDAIEPSTNLTEASRVLSGSIPAIVAEVVQRAKLAQLRREPKGGRVTKLSQEALLDAAKTMAAQNKLLQDRMTPPTPPATIDDLLAGKVNFAVQPVMALAEDIKALALKIKAEVE